MSNNIVNIDIKPKTVKETYRGYTIVYTYQPDDKKWHAVVSVERRRVDTFERVGKRKQDAQRLCKELIDRMED